LRFLHNLLVLVDLLCQIQYLSLKVFIHLCHLIQSFIKLICFSIFTLLDLLNNLLNKLVYFLTTILLLIVSSHLVLLILFKWSHHPLVHLISIVLLHLIISWSNHITVLVLDHTILHILLLVSHAFAFFHNFSTGSFLSFFE
jgi:hypothetical protein